MELERPTVPATWDQTEAYRELPDGRGLWIRRMLFTWRLIVGDPHSNTYDDGWCYPYLQDAVEGFVAYGGVGDPSGRWIKHLGSARRREYDATGELVREWVES